MIYFRQLHIKDYRSIKDATLVYYAGIWKVIGHNNDVEGFDSNGSGKSTVLTALQQCLFNRTTFGTSIESTYNKGSSKGYYLELIMTCNDTTYKIINDRPNMRLTVFKSVDGVWEDFGVKSIPQALFVIQDILGMDFNTFVATTYINHNTIVNLFENFTSSSIVKTVLNLEQLTKLDKELKTKLKDSVQESTKLAESINNVNATLAILNTFEYVDTEPISRQIAICQHKINDEITSSLVTSYTSSIALWQQELDNYNKELKAHQYQLHNRVCKCCNRPLDLDESYLTQRTNEVKKLIQGAEHEISSLREAEAKASEALKLKVQNLEKDLEYYQEQLHVATYKNSLYKEHQVQKEELNLRLHQEQEKLKTLLEEQSIITSIITTIKSGAPVKSIIGKLTDLLNNYIKEFSILMSIDYIKLGTKPVKNSIELTAYDTRFSTTIDVQELSGGEMTRLRIVLLLALLKAIRVLTGVGTNILVFDEALDTLDKAVATDLAMLFEYLSSTEHKFIAMVSHGSQLDEIKFDGVIVATKSNSTTTITQEV